MIKDLLTNKTAKEKAKIKSFEIAKLNHVGEYTSAEHGVRVEIQSLKEIEGGIELYARAWKGTEQLGFGKDGSVEWERFLIYNPPILVDDPNGTIVQEWTETLPPNQGQIKQRKLREDPIEAIRQTLAHTIKVTGKEGTNIVKGKRGSTVSTFYPDANPETTSVDGRAYRGPQNEIWGTIRAGAGEVGEDADVSRGIFQIIATTTTNQWQYLARGIFLFDTSAISATDNVSATVLSLYGLQKDDPDTNTPNLDIYTSTPATNTAVVAGDYGQIGAVSQTGSPITFANFSVTGYNDFPFDATGRGNIAKGVGGISKFGARNANYDVANVAPTWSSGGNSGLYVYMADQTGTANDPKLVVTHAAAAVVATAGLFFGTNF